MSGSGQAEGRARIAAPTRRLVGWSPADLRRWPGRTAAALHTGPAGADPATPADADPMAGPGPSDHWDGLLAYVAVNRSWIDGVVVDGPDPAGDPDLTSLLAALAEAGIPTRLITHGMHPGVLAHAVAEQLVVSVSLDVPTVPGRLAELVGRADAPQRLRASVAVLVNGGVDHDFRTSVRSGAVALDELPSLAENLRGGRLYALEPGQRADAPEGEDAVVDLVALRAAARACCASLPTIVRDAG